MSYSLNRINPNQTQLLFPDGRFETLTNEELDAFVNENSSEDNPTINMQITE